MRENRTLEFKLEISNTFLKTVSAFANFGDGEIWFGIDDNGKACGVENPTKACLDIENKINDAISPRPDFELRIEDENLVCLTVHKGSNTPYMYKGKAYRRSDSATIEAETAELRQLILDGSNLYFEELRATEQGLAFDYLAGKMKEQMGISALTSDVLRTIGFFTREEKYNNAACVFADENSLPGVDMARFGESISEIMDRETWQGVSVLKQYDAAVKMYQRYYQYDEIKGIERKTVEMVPEAAFREAIANAFVHRSWDLRSHVRISMFADCIEINSPGGLPQGITEDEYLHGNISCLRNPTIANVFFRLHYIEMFGTGVRRILKAYEGAIKQPTFRITENVISVTLPILEDKYDVSGDEEKVLSAIKSNKKGSEGVSSSKIVDATGLTKATTLRVIKRLMDKEYVKSSGAGRSVKYNLSSDTHEADMMVAENSKIDYRP